jgi:hypothetical protein
LTVSPPPTSESLGLESESEPATPSPDSNSRTASSLLDAVLSLESGPSPAAESTVCQCILAYSRLPAGFPLAGGQRRCHLLLRPGPAHQGAPPHSPRRSLPRCLSRAPPWVPASATVACDWWRQDLGPSLPHRPRPVEGASTRGPGRLVRLRGGAEATAGPSAGKGARSRAGRLRDRCDLPASRAGGSGSAEDGVAAGGPGCSWGLGLWLGRG